VLKLHDFKNLKEEVDCKICDNEGFIETLDKSGYRVAVRCECQKQRKTLLTLNKSGLIEDFKRYTFDNFNVTEEYQRMTVKKCYEFLGEFKNGVTNWFSINGQVGSGKTHLCTALSGQLIMGNKTFFYFPYMSLLPKLAMDLKNFYLNVKDEAEKLLEEIKNVDVLYIDDFLKNNDNLTLIWQIIDYRYKKKELITIFSSERFYDEMKRIDGSLASRIYQRCKGGEFFVEIGRNEERNYREKQ